jgi:hypothetical protein
MKPTSASLTAFCIGSLVAPSNVSPFITVWITTPRRINSRITAMEADLRQRPLCIGESRSPGASGGLPLPRMRSLSGWLEHLGTLTRLAFYGPGWSKSLERRARCCSRCRVILELQRGGDKAAAAFQARVGASKALAANSCRKQKVCAWRRTGSPNPGRGCPLVWFARRACCDFSALP